MQPYQSHERIEAIRFVYETEIKTLKQPFMNAIFRLNIVMSGKAVFRMCDMEYSLQKGSVFFTFPGYEYTITEHDSFTYTYISFTGKNITSFLSPLGITPETSVFSELEFLCNYFNDTIRLITPGNSNLLCESALLYALAFVSDINGKKEKKKRENLFNAIIDYVNHHFHNPDLSLKTLSNIYCYSPKYISSLIKENEGTGFSAYLNSLRIKRAKALMDKKEGSISDVATACGFNDPLYFSKVFRKSEGISPREYVNSAKSDIAAEIIRKYT
jgi:AraC-like DNA-binding protein